MDRVITKKIRRELEISKNKVILLIGQRQVGKTFELKRVEQEFGAILSANKQACLYFDFEDINNQKLFTPAVSVLESIIGDKNTKRLLLFDEIQYLEQAGSILKLLHDHFPETKIVATGSATFLLLKNIGDSLYGRNFTFDMHPLTPREIVGDIDNEKYQMGTYNKRLNKPIVDAQINNLLIYGSLPEVHLESDKVRKEQILKNYVSSLLFKDVLEIEGIRMPRVFKQLLKLLALQIGSEVNPNELAGQLEINRLTVVEYIKLYEKFKTIYTLEAFSNNPRKEITKGFKVYFSDLGIRNAVIDNFVQASSRTDKGALFENLVVNIFRQNIDYYGSAHQLYFWRTFTKAEVDLVLKNNETDKLIPIEIKYSQTKNPSKSFIEAYGSRIEKTFSVNKDNLWRFI
ncbi:ATP-binding protein [Patescibacteria group bacterium]|nr:ATP-binding protein [Patescibacteria group bacterium]